MATIVAEELVTVLSYRGETAPLVAADKAVDALDRKNKSATISADKLTAKMDDLAEQMQATSDKSLALKEQQIRLQRSIEATGKPTSEQRQKMHQLKMELEDNALHAKKLSASQKVLQRELKDTREATKKLADEEKKHVRTQQQATRETEKQAAAQRKLADAEARRTQRAKQTKEREALRARTAADRERASQARIGARGMRDDELTKIGGNGPEAKVARDELFKRKMNARAIANSAEDRKQNLAGFAKSGVEGKTGISLSGMTAGAAVAAGSVAAVAALAAGMAALGSKVFEVSKHFQSLRASLITVTGSAANADKQFAVIKDFASTTPYQVDQATEAFIKLKALGLDSSTKSLTSYGNTASAMGKDLNQMIEAVADATTGEFERLKEFGIKSKTVGDNVQFTFRGVTTTVKKDAQEIQDYLLALGDTQFAGAMQMQMDTIGGAVSNLADRWDAFLLRIGEGGQMEGLKRITQEVADLLSEDLATALGELQAEGTGILEDALGAVDTKDLQGIANLLTMIVKALRLGLQPVIKIIGFFVDVLAAAGRMLTLVYDEAMAWGRSLGVVIDKVKEFVSDSVLGGLLEMLSDGKEEAGGFFDTLGEAIKENIPYADDMARTWDTVSEALTGVESSAEGAKGALLDLVSGAFTKKLQELANKLELTGKRAVQGATVEQLQQLRAAGGEGGRIADAELARRADEEHTAREEELYQEGGGDKFKTDQLKEAEAGIEDAASDRADAVYRTARDGGMSAAEAKRLATVAKGEEIQKLRAQYDATGKAPPKRKKGKKGKAPKYEGLEKIVRTSAEQLGEQAGEREASRLTLAISNGKSTMTIEEAMEAGQTKRSEVRDQILNDFYATGKLPPGVRSDLQRLTEIPSVEQQIGKVAPPVISVNEYKVDASVGILNVGEGGTFTGSVTETAQAIGTMVKNELSGQLRVAIVGLTQGEMA